MTPGQLLAACKSLNDEKGKHGKRRMAELTGWDYSTLWRKLNGRSRITPGDELLVLKAVGNRGNFRASKQPQ